MEGPRITAGGMRPIPTLKYAISCVSNCQTQMCSGFQNAAIKISLVGEKWSDLRWSGGYGNRRVFLPSSTFHNPMTSSDFLHIAINCPSGENWATLASISVTSNSVLDFGVPFSTSHNLTRIEDPSIRWIVIILSRQ